MTLTQPLRPDWTPAACRGENPEWWFPAANHKAWKARQICSRCRIRQECLDWAVASGQEFGVWGGTTPEERLAMRKRAA